MKYKVGDKVQIIKEKFGHRFNIGDIVEITRVSEDDCDYMANSTNDYWYVRDDEIELINDAE